VSTGSDLAAAAEAIEAIEATDVHSNSDPNPNPEPAPLTLTLTLTRRPRPTGPTGPMWRPGRTTTRSARAVLVRLPCVALGPPRPWRGPPWPSACARTRMVMSKRVSEQVSKYASTHVRKYASKYVATQQ
jgi:hypothetical protein